jgi:hypothetical protein
LTAASLPPCPLPQDGRVPTAQVETVDMRQRFAVTLPAGWRALTPAEAASITRDHPGLLPADAALPQPPVFMPYGPVDDWLAGRFDGRWLAFGELDGEPEMSAAGVRAFAEHWTRVGQQQGARVKVVRLGLATAGRDRHPIVESVVEIAPKGAAPELRLEAFAPSAGKLLVFSVRARPDDPGAAALFADLLASLKIARPPRGPSRMMPRLIWAAAIGVGVGLILHMIRRRRAV